ncbi:unnamed protein product [Adineta steineri]|uniref:Uncharacterized protein n=1 Tax=Adineta steineri TaxID=433720 RepID=A0A814R343_9BILA|nr:unnamed protein product [Adineta steineri]
MDVDSSDIIRQTNSTPNREYSTISKAIGGFTSTHMLPVSNIVRPVYINTPGSISEKEQSWRSKFPKMPVLILSIIEFVLTIIIFIIEIASIVVLSNDGATGAGIWCAIPFLFSTICAFVLVERKSRSRIWSTRTLITQLILILFTFILISITGHYIENNSVFVTALSPNSYQVKYHLMQAQLASAVLLMFSGLTYILIYISISYIALWQPFHTLDINDHSRQIIHFE